MRQTLPPSASKVVSLHDLWRHSLAAIGRPWFPIAAILVVTTFTLPGLRELSLIDGCTVRTVLCEHELAREFLAIFWQALGGALALTVAGALFAFESASHARSESGLREFVERSRMLPFVMAGAAALGSIGVVLVTPTEPPPLTAAIVATSLGGLTLLLLPIFIRRAVHVVDADWFLEQVLEDVRTNVTAHIHAEARVRASASALRHLLEDVHGIETRVFLTGDLDEVEVAPIDGEVFDIDLKRLASTKNETLYLTGRPGDLASQVRPLIAAPARPERWRPVYTVVRGGRHRPVDRSVELIRDEAMRAIESASPARYEAISDVYVELLAAWPRAWESLGVHGSGEHLHDSRNALGWGPIDRITRDLYEQMLRAERLGLREHVYALITIPTRVALAVADLRPRQLLARMAGAARSFAPLAQPESPFASLIADRAWRYHLEVIERMALRHLDERPPAGVAEEWRDIAIDHVRGAAHLLRTFHQIGNTSAFDELDRGLRQLGQYSELDDRALRARLVLQTGDGAKDERAEAERDLILNHLRSEMLTERDAARLSLLAWLLRGADRSPETRARVRALLATLPSADRLVEAAARTMSHDGVLHDWISMSMPTGEVHSIDCQTPALRALAFCLLSMDSVAEVPAVEWLPRRQDAVLRAICDGEVQEGVASLQGVDIEVVRSRADDLVELVVGAAAAVTRAEEDRLIATELAEAKVLAFRAELQDAHCENRVLEGFGALSGFDVKPVESSGPGWGFTELVPKEPFVDEPGVVVIGMSGGNYGKRLASDEIEAVVRRLVEQAVPVARAPDGVAARVDHLLSVMLSAGYPPSLILLPRRWRVQEQLGIPFAPTGGSLHQWLAGTYEGIPVLKSNSVPPQRIIAADMARALDVRDELSETGRPEPPNVEVLPVDAARATKIASQWSAVDDAAAADRLRTLKQRVELRIFRDLQISVTDRLAVRSVWLPPRDRNAN